VALLFALNHGVVTTPLGVASSLLAPEVANTGNGVLFSATLLSSLLLGAPVVGGFGAKQGLLAGMLLYCVYVGCFGLAVLCDPGAPEQWQLFLAGSGSGGLAAGVLWTAQGSYLSSSVAALAAADPGRDRDVSSAELSGGFATIYLGLEVVSKLGFSALQALGLGAELVALGYFLIGAAALAGATSAYDLSPSGGLVGPRGVDAGRAPAAATAKVTAAVSLWSDPVLWLLAPTNLTFGFCAAYMNGFVNGTYATQELGRSAVAGLTAVTALAAALLAQVYGPLSGRFGKGLVLCVGALSFAAIPLATPLLGCCDGWGWGVLALYLLQGSGRAVYESTNRAVFSDLFQGERTEGAFANCQLQSSLAFALCFFLQGSLAGGQLQGAVVALALLTPPGFLLAERLRRAEREEGA